jgi:hypothetical protein
MLDIQMNGAELANNVVLHVQPAESQPDTPSMTIAPEPVANAEGGKEDEDLDDFFNSL